MNKTTRKNSRVGSFLFFALCLCLISIGTASCVPLASKSNGEPSHEEGRSAGEGRDGSNACTKTCGYGGDADIFAGRFLNGRTLFAKDIDYECRDKHYYWRPGYRSALHFRKDGSHEIQQDACIPAFTPGKGSLNRSEINPNVVSVNGVESIRNLTFERAQGIRVEESRVFVAEQPYLEAWCQSAALTQDDGEPTEGGKQEYQFEVEGPASSTGTMYILSQFAENTPPLRYGPLNGSRSVSANELKYVYDELDPEGRPIGTMTITISLTPDVTGRYPAQMAYQIGERIKTYFVTCQLNLTGRR